MKQLLAGTAVYSSTILVQNDAMTYTRTGIAKLKYRVVKAYLNAERRIIDDEMVGSGICGCGGVRYRNIKGVTVMIAQAMLQQCEGKYVIIIKIVSGCLYR